MSQRSRRSAAIGIGSSSSSSSRANSSGPSKSQTARKRPIEVSSASPAPTKRSSRERTVTAQTASPRAGPSSGTKKATASKKPALGSDDEDSDEDFFIRRRPAARRAPSQKGGAAQTAAAQGSGGATAGPSSPPRLSDVDDDDEEDDSDSSSEDGRGAGRPRRKIQRLPSWTREVSREPSQQAGGRGSSAIRLLSDGEEEADRTEKAGTGRSRSPSLTPPPELGADYKARVQAILESAIPDLYKKPQHRVEDDDDDDDDDETLGVGASSGRNPRDDRSGQGGDLQIHPDLAPFYRGPQAAEIRRAAAERRRQEELEREKREKEREAAREQERQKRTAESLHRPIEVPDSSDAEPEATLPAHRASGQASDAISLGSDSDDDDDGHPPPAKGKGRTAATSTTASSAAAAAAAAPPPPPPEADDPTRITLRLRARTGEIELKVRPTTIFGSMLAHFLKGADCAALTDKQRKSAKLMFDGEVLELGKAVQDIEELEEDELIDVVW